jgi:hypothetical protein
MDVIMVIDDLSVTNDQGYDWSIRNFI